MAVIARSAKRDATIPHTPFEAWGIASDPPGPRDDGAGKTLRC